MNSNKVYLHCRFEEKELVKRLGARWDGEKKSWFIPDGVDSSRFAKWLTQPVGSPGESGVGGLYVDLVPSSCFYSNVRSMLSQGDWDTIRKSVYASSNRVCSICGGFGPSHPVEAHERWVFDTSTRVQKLEKVEALCPACHQATHIGLAQVNGLEHVAVERLMYVNAWSRTKTNEHVAKAFFTWHTLSAIDDWQLDLTLVDFIQLVS